METFVCIKEPDAGAMHLQAFRNQQAAVCVQFGVHTVLAPLLPPLSKNCNTQKLISGRSSQGIALVEDVTNCPSAWTVAVRSMGPPMESLAPVLECSQVGILQSASAMCNDISDTDNDRGLVGTTIGNGIPKSALRSLFPGC